MALLSVKSLIDADAAGQTFFSAWRKVPTQVTGAGFWFDLSMSPGNPVPNYYAAAPNVAVALAQSTDGGIPHGGSVGQLGQTKYLMEFMAMTQTAAAVPLPMLLCDYLMYYPFIDMSITDPQPLTTNITLPRIPSGKNVQIMAVTVAAPSGVGNPQFYLTYTNSDGVSGRTSQTVSTCTQTVNGTIATASPAVLRSAGPFIPLQPGDKGVQKIESVTFLTPDVGLLAFVLVDVIENTALRTIDAPVERVPFLDNSDLPIIYDDAYLNLICYTNGSLTGAPINGIIKTIWN